MTFTHTHTHHPLPPLPHPLVDSRLHRVCILRLPFCGSFTHVTPHLRTVALPCGYTTRYPHLHATATAPHTTHAPRTGYAWLRCCHTARSFTPPPFCHAHCPVHYTPLRLHTPAHSCPRTRYIAHAVALPPRAFGHADSPTPPTAPTTPPPPTPPPTPHPTTPTPTPTPPPPPPYKRWHAGVGAVQPVDRWFTAPPLDHHATSPWVANVAHGVAQRAHAAYRLHGDAPFRSAAAVSPAATPTSAGGMPLRTFHAAHVELPALSSEHVGPRVDCCIQFVSAATVWR